MIAFDEQALADLERIFEFNFERDPSTALEHVDAVRTAVSILEMHPEIGRPIGGSSTLRELVISHGKTGYIALYEFHRLANLIRIVAVRHQREAGYRGR